ncbi:hypothetical protein LK994_13375 [Ferruginibacter lapsinanis]|uniref:hypothetical protein n=1 Tax=Ferruginibacter lapsinanis TaxID=563172 RepID=UPI001E2A6C4C|nr:hypothetical protein [Ferruginibacter lapsinanis]UEG49627.1 hypothetical protein LK994_13375 [Ferruginibacter lapsinanis]
MNVLRSYIKKIIPLFILVCTNANGFAQNIGFGVSNPAEKLEIDGKIKFRDTGKIIAVNNLHRILFRRNEQIMELREEGDIILSANAVSGNETSTMIIKNTGSVGIGTKTPNPAAILDLSSNNKGFLPPSITYAQRLAIANPPAGLTIWCNNCDTAGELQVYNGTMWTNAVGGTAQPYIPNRLYIGQYYQGGIIFYLLKEGDPGFDLYVQHGLIAAPSDTPNTVQGSGRWAWSINNTNMKAGSSTAIGSGNANSNLIVNNSAAPYPIAARMCLDYSANGYSDWFMPSKDELNQLYVNRSVVPGLANSTKLYFSSSYFVPRGSQFSDNLCWGQGFDTGTQAAIPYNPQAQWPIRKF